MSIEADVIEELARFIGFATIEPTLPRVSVRRFEPDRMHDLERKTLSYLTTAGRFIEIAHAACFPGVLKGKSALAPNLPLEIVLDRADLGQVDHWLATAFAYNRGSYAPKPLGDSGVAAGVSIRADVSEYEFKVICTRNIEQIELSTSQGADRDRHVLQ